MKTCILILIMVNIVSLNAQPIEKTGKSKIYLIYGQGSGYRLFEKFNLDKSFNSINFRLSVPSKRHSMNYPGALWLRIHLNISNTLLSKFKKDYNGILTTSNNNNPFNT